MLTTGKLLGAGGTKQIFGYITSASSLTTSVTLSEAPKAGDIILVSAHDQATSPISAWVSIPSGYTRITRATYPWNANYALQVDMGYKKATGSEGTTISGFSWTSTGGLVSCVSVFRPTFSVTTITAGDVETSTNTTTKVLNATASSAQTISFIALTGGISETHTNNRTMDYELTALNGNTDVYSSALFAKAGNTVDITMSGLAGGLGFVYTHCYLSLT